MAQIITLPRAPETALPQLGNMLYAGISEASDRRRRDDEIARLRQERLADISEQRRYVEGREGVARTQQLEDEQRNRGLRLEDEKRIRENNLKAFLQQKGLLTPADFDNPSAVATAYELAARDAQMAANMALILTGDLDPAYVDSPNAVKGALTAAGTRARTEREGEKTREDQMRERAQGMANKLLIDEQALQGEIATLAQQMNQPPEIPSPNDPRVMNRARQIWSASNPGKVAPTDSNKLSAEIAQAQQDLEDAAIQNWQVKQMSGREIFKSLKKRLDSIDATRRSLINVRVFSDPASMPTAPQTQGAPRSLPPVDPEAARASARAAAVRASAPFVGPRQTPQGGAPQVMAAPPPASQAAPRVNPSQFTFPGGVLGAMERMGASGASPEPSAPLSPEQVSRATSGLAKVPTFLDRAAGALGSGLIMGDFSVPERGGLETLGQAYGDAVVTGQQEWEDKILATRPQSSEAFAIRRKRGLPEPFPQSAHAGF